MGRKIRTTIPLTAKQLTPQWPYLAEFRRLDGRKTLIVNTEYTTCRKSLMTLKFG